MVTKTLNWLFFFKIQAISPAVQWLRLGLPMQDVQVQYLVEKLRSQVPLSQKTKTEDRSVIVTNTVRLPKKKYVLYKKWSSREGLSDGVDDRYIIVAQPGQPNRRWCHLLRGYTVEEDKVRVGTMNQFGEQSEGLAGLQLKTFSDFQAQWVAPSITEGRGG